MSGVDDFLEDLRTKFRELENRLNNLEAAESPYVRVSTINTSNPPTAAQLTAAFGSPATVRAGYLVVVDDNGAHTNEYFVWSDGTFWFYATGTKAA